MKVKKFQNFFTNVTAGYTYGKDSPNMSFKYGEPTVVQENILSFYKNLKFVKNSKEVTMRCQHGESMLEISNSNLDSEFNCDAIFTTLPNVIISVAPADCIITLFHAKSARQEIVGLIHTGKLGVNLKLGENFFKFLMSKYNIFPSNIYLALSPCISEKFYTNNFIDNLDLNGAFKDSFTFKAGQCHLNIKKALLNQYSGLGLTNIFDSNIDTFSSAKRGLSFSHKLSTLDPDKFPEGRFMVSICRKDKKR